MTLSLLEISLMTVELGLFDIQQIDPTDPDDSFAVYQRRLDDLTLADDVGLTYAFTAERHFMATYRCPAPTAWIGAATQRTRSIRLGVMANTLPIHSPVRLAEDVAVLDHLSNGRLEVGLGLGHRIEELVALGVDPTKRIEIFQQRFAMMQALWNGGQVSIETDEDTLKEVAIHPLPLQVPHPPIWYAGTDLAAATWAASRGMNLAVGFKPLRDLVPATAGFKAGRKALEETLDEVDSPVPAKVALMRHLVLAETTERARSEMIDTLQKLHGPHAPAEGSRGNRRAEAAAEADRLLKQEIFIAGGPEDVANDIWYARRVIGVNVFLANVYAAGITDDQVRRTIKALAGPVKDKLAELAKEEEAPVSAG
jgi:alkanesulfonate monooxygenase SsuD/methylene tetrahydromethanopterin reductase-like flavin-dependent oxidoreductase (luciferase family)